MKNATLFLLLLSLLPLIAIAQPPGGGRPGGGRPGGGRPQLELADNTGALIGRVADERTEEAILLANVLVYQAGTEELLTGTTTNERGMFVVKDLPYGSYDLEISYLGYADYRSENLAVSADERVQRTGRIMLGTDANNLEEVKVTAERAAVEFGLDRKVFNVERDVASTGGTAEDLLRNIPSVTVDLDGNISLRGSSNIRILINGKPSTLTGLDRQGFLQQLAAGMIESIEVLTNPSAKYDPEGMGGIINIITKQQNKPGFNVRTAVNVGTNDKYNGNVNLNYRVGKFNLQSGYSYNNDTRWFRGMRYRTTMTADTSWIQDQDIDGERQRLSHTFQGGVEYFAAPRASISLRGNYSDRTGEDVSFRNNRFLDGNQDPIFSTLRREEGNEVKDSWEVNFDYRQRFRDKGRELTVTAQRSEEEEVENENFFEDFFDADGTFLETDRQLNPQPQNNDVWLFQADYTHPINKTTTAETGSRVTLRGISIDNQLFDFDPDMDDFVFVPEFSNLFSYQEDVYAAYGILKGTFAESWKWQAGLRAENTRTEAKLLQPTQEVFPNEYFSLFPSAFLTYEINETTGVQFNYSRRINRPRFRSLNPFIDYSDPLNPRSGNPLLQPEFINSFEVNYLRSSEIGSLSMGVYLREISNMVTRISTPDPVTGVNLRVPTNLNTGRNYGVEVVGTLRPVDKLQLVISGNAYRSEIDGNNLETELNNVGYQFSGRMQASYTFFKDLSAQLTGFYRSPGVRPQGEMRGFGSVDLGFRKPILKGKANITLRASDLFQTRKFSFLTVADFVTSDATFQRESRIVYLGFNYSLRQEKNKRERGSRDRNRDDGGDDDF